MITNTVPISIVCASHQGRLRLPILVRSIYASTWRPKEIVICGTNRSDIDLIDDPDKLVKFVLSTKVNQIHQRRQAIDTAESRVIVQSDDDLVFSTTAIAELVVEMRTFSVPIAADC